VPQRRIILNQVSGDNGNVKRKRQRDNSDNFLGTRSLKEKYMIHDEKIKKWKRAF